MQDMKVEEKTEYMYILGYLLWNNGNLEILFLKSGEIEPLFHWLKVIFFRLKFGEN